MNINNTYKSAIHKETTQQSYLFTNHGGSRFISSSLSWYLLSSYRMAWPACDAEDRLPVALELLALQSCLGDRCSPEDKRRGKGWEGMREEREERGERGERRERGEKEGAREGRDGGKGGERGKNNNNNNKKHSTVCV